MFHVRAACRFAWTRKFVIFPRGLYCDHDMDGLRSGVVYYKAVGFSVV